MVFKSFARFFGEWWATRRATRRGRKVSPLLGRKYRLAMDLLEDRVTPANLPAPVVSNPHMFLDPTNTSTDFGLLPADNLYQNPAVAMDPLDPNRMVMVATRPWFTGNPLNRTDHGLVINYTTDRGTTWQQVNWFSSGTQIPPSSFSSGFISTNSVRVNRIIDPQSPLPSAGNQFNYQRVVDPSVAFDRGGNFYITALERDDNQESGAIVFYKFDFSGPDPINIINEQVLHRWFRGPANSATFNILDSAYSPVIGIDTNVPEYTDPQTGLVQRDSLANMIPDPNRPGELVPKAIYVAWTSRERSELNADIGVIKIIASGDGGATFSTQQNVSDFNSPGSSNARPQFFFTQGTPFDPNDPNSTPRVAGGQVGLVWDNFTTGPAVTSSMITFDVSQPDGGDPLQPAVVNAVFTGQNNTTILDAAENVAANNNTAGDLRRTTLVPVTVDITNPNFDFLVDLEVNVALQHPHLDQLLVELVSPDGTSVTLMENRTLSNGTQRPSVNGIPGVPDQANLGVSANNRDVFGTTFSMSAMRTLNNRPIPNNSPAAVPVTPFAGSFLPEDALFGGGFDQYFGRTPSQLNGIWFLRITDMRYDGNNPGPSQLVRNFTLRMTSQMNKTTAGNGPGTFGNDQTALFSGQFGGNANLRRGTMTTPYTANGGVFGPPGVGPGISVVVDNSLGSFSPFQGRVYIAYNGFNTSANATNSSNVYLLTSDTIGDSPFTTFNQFTNIQGFDPLGNATPINDDTSSDGFSEGNRIQYNPTLAVDRVTGTLSAMWYDARHDPSNLRVTNYFASSINGGQTFSPQVYLNIPKTALDALTGKTINIEPIPGNPAQAGILGFGDRQSLLAYDGKAYPFFTSNLNVAPRNDTDFYGTQRNHNTSVNVFTAEVHVGAGPRILQGDQGPVVQDFSTGFGLSYNDTFASDGTRQLDGFVVGFDRPIDPASFGPNDVQVRFQSPFTSTKLAVATTATAGTITVTSSTGFPASGFQVRIGSEILNVLSRVDNVWTVARGVNGTTGTAHAINDTVALTDKYIDISNQILSVTPLDQSASQSLTDPGTPPSVSIGDVFVHEGASGQTTARFYIYQSMVRTTPTTVDYITGDGSAVAGADYVATSGRVTIPAGKTSAFFDVPVLGNTGKSGNRYFWAGLSNVPTGIVGNKTLGKATILDDDDAPKLAIGDAVVREGNNGTTFLDFPVYLSSPTSVTLSYQTSDGTASGLSDYTPTAGSTTISSVGGGTPVISIPVQGDTTFEPNETLRLNLTGVNARSEQQTLILSASDPTNATVTLRYLGENAATTLALRTMPSAAAVQAHLETIFALTGNVSVTSSVPGTYIITFINNLAGQDVPILEVGPTASGGTASISETLKGGGGGDNVLIVRPNAIGVIVDDDDLAVSVGDVTVQEGTDASATVTFFLNGPTGSNVDITYSITSASALANSDYSTPIPGQTIYTTSIPATPGGGPSNTTATAVIPILADNLFEPTENFVVTILSVTNAGIDKGTAQVKIIDDDAPNARVYVADSAIKEGDLGNSVLSVRIQLSQAVPFDVTGFFSTGGGTAMPGPDFTSVANAPWTILAGQTSTTVDIDIVGDLLVEPTGGGPAPIDETIDYSINVSTPGIALGRQSGTATIVDDDVHIYLADAMEFEGQFMRFEVFLDSPKDVDITFQWSTADDSALAASDYAAQVARTATIFAGQTSITLSVPTTQDTAGEANATNGANERFFAIINPNSIIVGGVPATFTEGSSILARGQANGVIVDNDAAGLLTIENPTVLEDSGQITFRVFLSQPDNANDILFNFSTQTDTGTFGGAQADGNFLALPDDDYVHQESNRIIPPQTAPGPLLRIPRGATVRQFTVPINADVDFENNETFLWAISTPQGATLVRNEALQPTLGFGFGRGTILNDDRLHAVIVNALVPEGNSGTTNVTSEVVLSNPAPGFSTISLTRQDDTATSPEDYVSANSTAFIFGGGLTATINSSVRGDSNVEGDEAFNLAVTASTIPVTTISPRITILEDDVPFITVGDFSVQEDPNGTATATVTFYINGDPSQNVSVDYAFQNGTAVNGIDYQGVPGTVTFTPGGPKSQTITVPILTDGQALGNKTFSVVLSNATAGAGTATRSERQRISFDAGVGGVVFGYKNARGSLISTANLNAATVLAGLASIPGLGTNEQQTIVIQGNSTFEFFDFNGDFASISFSPNAASATASDIQTGLETQIAALAGNITVSGNVGGPFVVTFINQLGGVDVPLIQSFFGSATITETRSSTASVVVTQVGPNQFDVDFTGVFGNQDIPLIQVLETRGTGTVSVNEVFPGGTAPGVGTIIDGSMRPALAISPVAIVEGASATTSLATFSVYSSFAIAGPITFTINTADGTATVANGDYVGLTNQVFTLDAGTTRKDLTVVINGDANREGDETFTATLSNPTNARIAAGSGTATATIVDDDDSPTLSIGDAIVREGDYGLTEVTITVTLNKVATVPVVMQYLTADGSALGNLDFVPASAPLTIPAGLLSETFILKIEGDSIKELDEVFFVNISNVTGASVVKDQARVLIQNNDGTFGATQFLVSIAPQSKVGTYSYVVGPKIRDRIRTAGSDEKQYVTASFGTFTLTFNGSTTGSLSTFNAAGVQAALNNLPSILGVGGSVTVTGNGTSSAPYEVLFQGSFAGTNVAPMTAAFALVETSRQGGTVDAFDDGSVGSYTPAPGFQNIPVGGSSSTLSLISVSGLAGNQVVRDLTVTVNLDHPDPTNSVTIDLIAPDGRVVNLFRPAEFAFSFADVQGGNLFNTTFDQYAPTLLGNADAPFTGSVQPSSSLQSRSAPINSTDLNGNFTTSVPLHMLEGSPVIGTWTLRVTDSSGLSNVGTLRNWTLNLDTGASLPGQLGNAMDQNHGGIDGEKIRTTDAFAAPDPVNGVPFELPYDNATSPLIIPGPHAVDFPYTFFALESVRVPSAAFGGSGTQADLSSSTIVVQDIPVGELIQDVNVSIVLNHPNLSDLRLTLIAPDGTRIALSRNQAISGKTTFSDQLNLASQINFVAPLDRLGKLNGKNPNGTWTLQMEDTVFPSQGTLFQWSLEIQTERLALNQDIAFKDITFDRDINVATFQPGNILRMTGPVGTIPGPFTITALNPQDVPVTVGGVTNQNGQVARTFRISFPTQTLSGTYSFVFGPDSTNPNRNTNYIADRFGNQLDRNFNAGLDVLRGGDPTNAEIVNVTTTFVPAPGGTPFNGGGQVTDIAINVTEDFLVQGARVGLSLTHNRIADLEARLVSPAGTVVPLFLHVAGTSNNSNIANLVLDDAARDPIQSGSPPYNASFIPQRPLSTFRNESSAGTWSLQITNDGSAGAITDFFLTLFKSVAGTGLGEQGADQFQDHFRVFIQDPTNALTSKQWTGVGPSADNINDAAGAPIVPDIVVDPADPSGNTVYAATSNGGVWKTSNFLTSEELGPTWVPLLDFGPINANGVIGGNHGLNVGSVAVFARNRDPNQTIVFVGTGGAGGTGTGLLRSMDGGQTWQVLDSFINVDAQGNVTPVADPSRLHQFSNTLIEHLAVDPTPSPSGHVILYMTVTAAPGSNNPNAGLYRSNDSGNTWTLIRAGTPTDLVLVPSSKGPTGNLQLLYAAFANQGVFRADSAPAATGMFRLDGNQGVGNRLDDTLVNGVEVPVPVTNPVDTPTTNAAAEIRIAVPAPTGDPQIDLLHQGFIYAITYNATANSSLPNSALYVSKDFGANWTRVKIPVHRTVPANNGLNFYQYGTNDENYNPINTPQTSPTADFPRFNLIAVDPNNANIVYLGFDLDFARPANLNPGTNLIRVDLTTLADPYALVQLDNSENDGGQLQIGSVGSTSPKPANPPANTLGGGQPYGIIQQSPNGFITYSGAVYNSLRDAPFLDKTSQVLHNTARFNNDGGDVSWKPALEITELSFPGGFPSSYYSPMRKFQKILPVKDPVTGLTRLILGSQEGLYVASVNADGTLFKGEGFNLGPVNANRTGNMQAAVMWNGAAQPSILAADVSQSLFFGMDFFGGYNSTGQILQTGNLAWVLNNGVGTEVNVDPRGNGVFYEYIGPGPGGQTTVKNPSLTNADFFQITNPGQLPDARVNGLINVGAGDNPAGGVGQWPSGFRNFPYNSSPAISPMVGNFSINPFEPGALILSSNAGRIFRSSGSSDQGRQWFEIGTPSATFAALGQLGDVDNIHKSALAFGAPDPTASAALSNFIYAGSRAGRIFVTTSPGPGNWRNISAGLDNTQIRAIVPSPVLGSREVFAVTFQGIYWMRDSLATGATWVRLNDVQGKDAIFQKTYKLFGTAEQTRAANILTDLAVDWRFSVPDFRGSVTAASNAGPIVITSPNHGLATGTQVKISGVAGNTNANGTFSVTVLSTDTFSLNGTTGNGTYSGGGTWATTSTHPVLFVSTDGGVFRSTDMGANWKIYPSITDQGATEDGGYLPHVLVSDIDLILGNTTPGSGFVNESTGFNMLYASTYGRSAYAIRLDNSDVEPFRTTAPFGPRVVGAPVPFSPGTQTTMQGLDITFSTTVDPNTFTAQDILSFRGPSNQNIVVSGVQQLPAVVPGTSVFRILFAGQSQAGNYTISFGPNITDFAGNKMDQDGDNLNGENPGDIFTRTFTFTPNTAPTITPAFTDRNVVPGTPSDSVNFTIGDAQTPGQLTVTATSSNTSFVPNSGLQITGTGTARTLTITPNGGFGITTITVTVTDPQGLQTVASFNFSVDNAPTLAPIANPAPLPHSRPGAPSVLNIPLVANDVDGQTLTFLTPTTSPFATTAFTQEPNLGMFHYATNVRGFNEKWFFANVTKQRYVMNTAGQVFKFNATLTGSPFGQLVVNLTSQHHANPKLAEGLIRLWDDYLPNNLSQGEKSLWTPVYGRVLLLPSGALHRYSGIPSAPIGALLATFGPEHYANPSLLHDPSAPLNPPAGTVTIVGSNLMIQPPDNWIGSFTVTATVSDGFLSASRTFNVTVFNQRPTVGAIAEPTPQHHAAGPVNYTVPVADADADTLTYQIVSTVAAASSASTFKTQFGLVQHGVNFSRNAAGQNEVYFRGTVTGKVYALFPSGQLRQYVGGQPFTAWPVVGTLDPFYNANPNLVINPVPAAAPPAGSVTVANGQVTVNTPTSFVGSFRVTLSATDNISTPVITSFVVTVYNQAPDFTVPTEQTIDHAIGPVTFNLNPTDPDPADANAVTFTVSTSAAINSAFSIFRAYGLVELGTNFSFNTRGLNEKYFFGNLTKKVYVLFPDGKFRDYNATDITQGRLLFQLDPVYWAQPNLMVDPVLPFAPPAGTVTVTNGVLTITPPANYSGTFRVTVSASDGTVPPTTKTFVVSIINRAPVLDPINSDLAINVAQNGSAVIPVSGTDPDAGDSVSFSVVPSAALRLAYTLDSQRGLIRKDGTYDQNRLGLNEKWIYSTVHSRFFLLLPTGAFYLYSGNPASPLSTLMGTLPTDFYLNPALLHEAATPFAGDTTPTAPPPDSVGVSLVGNTLTINPNGFVGNFELAVLITDGITVGFRKVKVIST